MLLRLSSLEVFRRGFEYFDDVVGDLTGLWHGTGFYFDVAQLLVVKVALLLDAFYLLQECLVLEKLSCELVFERLHQVLQLLLARGIDHLRVVSGWVRLRAGIVLRQGADSLHIDTVVQIPEQPASLVIEG